MVDKVKTRVKVPISKAKFFGYVTNQDKQLDEQNPKGKGPMLLRTMTIGHEITTNDLSNLAKFFLTVGEEEYISHILITKNTLQPLDNTLTGGLNG